MNSLNFYHKRVNTLGLKYNHVGAAGFMKQTLNWLMEVPCKLRHHLPEVTEFAAQILSNT